jgi:hypothetical protein
VWKPLVKRRIGWIVRIAGTTLGIRGATEILEIWRHNVLSAENQGIDRPGSGPNHGQRSAEDGQEERNDSITWRHESETRFKDCDHNTGDRGPQAGDQQNTGERSDTLGNDCRANRIRSRANNATINERSASEQSLEQQPATRPTFREGGEQRLHTIPLSE